MNCLICNKNSEKSLCDDCSNEKDVKTVIHQNPIQISTTTKTVKCTLHAKCVLIKR